MDKSYIQAFHEEFVYHRHEIDGAEWPTAVTELRDIALKSLTLPSWLQKVSLYPALQYIPDLSRL